MAGRHSHRAPAFGVLIALVVATAVGCGPGDGGDKTRPDETSVYTAPPPSATTPELGSGDQGSSFDEPFTYGDNATLDSLWDACGEGDAYACSDLFFESPVDSDYETFGATCGQTAEWGTCAFGDDEAPPSTGASGEGDGTGSEGSAGSEGTEGGTDDGTLGGEALAGGGDWWASAEEACTSVYLTRGASQWSLSNDYHDDMMLYYMWLADLLAREADVLAGIGGAPAEGEAMIEELSYLSDLYREEAGIESEHYLINQRQNEIDAQTPLLSESIQLRAQAGGAPTCGELTSGNSG